MISFIDAIVYYNGWVFLSKAFYFDYFIYYICITTDIETMSHLWNDALLTSLIYLPKIKQEIRWRLLHEIYRASIQKHELVVSKLNRFIDII